MRLKESHGRKGESTEYYSWKVVKPEVFVQRVGERWLLGITHTDRTSQVLAYFEDLACAKVHGKALTQRYVYAENYTVREDVHIAEAFWKQLDVKRKELGITTIVTAT